LIGVSTSEVRRAETLRATEQGEPPHHELALGLVYLRAVERAGGLPVVLPPLEGDAIEPLLDRLSGVCLSGGPDLDPQAYGERASERLGPTEPRLDRFELDLARRADARGMPILGICRGLQTLNVMRGGTLHQHLPDLPGASLAHRQSEPADRCTHPVVLDPGSWVAEVLGAGTLEVNSFHHQGIRRPGRGLRPVGWAPDGVVEAIEDPKRDFLVGVQWHAEGLADRADHRRLFEAFVAAARRHEFAQHPARAA